MFKKTITQLFILTIVLSSIFIANGLILAWTSPGSTPPSSNVSPPINTSATAQTKSGSLRSSADMRAPIFYDQNNTGYYVDPASTSRLNYGVYDNLYSYGWMQSPIFYDANNTGYYVDPASTSKFNTINLGGVSKSSWPSGGSSSVNVYQCPKITYTYGCYGWQNGCEGQITTLGVCRYCSGGVWRNYSCTYLGKMMLE